MRLIDADALKKAVLDLDLDNSTYWLVVNAINNTPTVDTGDSKYLEERDADAYESGYIQGLSERPTGGKVVHDVLQGWIYKETEQ